MKHGKNNVDESNVNKNSVDEIKANKNSVDEIKANKSNVDEIKANKSNADEIKANKSNTGEINVNEKAYSAASGADWEWLCSIPGIYHAHQEILLRVFGSPEAVRKSSEAELELLRKKGCKWVEKVQKFQKEYSVDRIVNDRCEKGIQFISCTHADYPARMRQIINAPYGLFFRGMLPPDEERTAAVIGARMCTREGKNLAEQLARKIVQAGGAVVSGAAYGIDGAAQWAAMEAGGKSYALLGCGVDVVYPASHRLLLERLGENGGVISELPCGTPPLRSHFPMRNRLISGFSDIVAVVEAKKKSGSLITADFAAEQGKTVMAVPGRPEDELSEGCNELIAQGAGLILSAESFAKIAFPDYKKDEKENSENLILASSEKLVYSSFGLHPKSLWELQADTALSLGELSETLWTLVQKKMVKETEWNYFIKIK